MDEAGYGPNLGPLILAATRWKTPGPPAETHFFDALQDVVSQDSASRASKLQVADSKRVNTGPDGFRALETSALSITHVLDSGIATFRDLWRFLSGGDVPQEPAWFADARLDIPVKADPDVIGALSLRLRTALDREGLELAGIQCEVATANRFNQLLDDHESKGMLLSRLAFGLLRRMWSPSELHPTLFVGDKHGGRNRYDQLLAEVLDSEMIFRQSEGRALSQYRVGNTELRFQTNGERHFPVAVSSIVAKYLRELSMILFNRFWCDQIPDLKPTKGYPVDAARFRKEIQGVQSELGIDDRQLWRNR